MQEPTFYPTTLFPLYFHKDHKDSLSNNKLVLLQFQYVISYHTGGVVKITGCVVKITEGVVKITRGVVKITGGVVKITGGVVKITGQGQYNLLATYLELWSDHQMNHQQIPFLEVWLRLSVYLEAWSIFLTLPFASCIHL